MILIAVSCTEQLSLVDTELIQVDDPNVRGNSLDERALTASSQRNLNPAVTELTLSNAIRANNQFGFNLYRELIKSPNYANNNVIFSPLAITMPLAIFYEGSRGETEFEMNQGLQFPLLKDELHSALNRLDLDLVASASLNAETDFNLRHSLWFQQGFPVSDLFSGNVSNNYAADIFLTDFVNYADLAERAINLWGRRVSRGLFNTILSEKNIDPSTRIIQASVLYFSGEWKKKFSTIQTSLQEFQLLSGELINVPTMSQLEDYNYLQTSNYQVLELNYFGKEFSILLILPNVGQFPEVETNLTPEFIQLFDDKSKEAWVQILLPKFAFSTSQDLRLLLPLIGVRYLFDSAAADLSGITDLEQLYVSNMIHNAKISVNEDGTEAGAATAVYASIVSEPILFEFNRPFLFILRDKRHNSILFMGRVLDPSVS